MKNKKKSVSKALLKIIWNRKKIDAKQLLLLLQYDNKIRNEIHSIVINNGFKENIEIVKEDEIIEKNNQKNLVSRKEELNFNTEEKLLNILLEDNELAKNWVESSIPRDRKIVQLIVSASKWNNIQGLWKTICKRCNKRENKATENEFIFLKGCLDLHNLQWKESEVRFDKPEEGSIYNHEKHQRASITPTGEKIENIWLYGLKSADGKLDSKSVVVTKK